MNKNADVKGHIGAVLTVLVWGTTFVSTKVLLNSFSPVEILVMRFVVGTLALCVMLPRRLRLREKKHHLYFLAAGLCGVTLYYLMENIALTYTTASNVGVIVSVAPLFTALVLRLFYPAEKLRLNFFLGFAAALCGIFVISFAGAAVTLNPMGDLLALLAAVCWAFYSVLVKKIGTLGYNNIQATRRIFLYGMALMLPAALVLGFAPSPAAILQPVNLLNLLYLGLGASAVCFVTWNFALRTLGPIKAGAYIYAVPVVTVVCSALVLGEPVTPAILAGILLTLAGLVISEWQPHKKTAP